jgi:CO dehydrogenase maturation factor
MRRRIEHLHHATNDSHAHKRSPTSNLNGYMRLAFIGKGGSGKSTVAGTAARLLGRQEGAVLALDVDPLPGLAFSVGLGRVPEGGLPEELAERREGKGWVLKEEVSAETLVDRYALQGPDGVRFMQLGKMPGHVRPGSTTAFRHVVETFHRPGWSVVGDLSAGTRQAFAGWGSFATRLVIVSELSSAGLLTARRLKRMAETFPEAAIGLVINKTRGANQAAEKADELGIPLWAVLPYDEEMAQAERSGRAPIDVAPNSPVVIAIEGFVETIREGTA